MRESRRKIGKRSKAVMFATILGFLASFFKGAPDLLRQITKLFQGNPETKKQKVDDANNSEESARDQGGRPQYDKKDV